MLKNLLLYRFLLFNAAALSCVGLAWFAGLLSYLYQNDLTYLTYTITGLFTLVWGATFKRVVDASRGLNRQKAGHGSYVSPRDARKTWAKLRWLSEGSEFMVGLGLIGTIIGFSIALSGVDPGNLGSSTGVSAAIGPLMVGMKIALNTTIVGTIAAIWIQA